MYKGLCVFILALIGLNVLAVEPQGDQNSVIGVSTSPTAEITPQQWPLLQQLCALPEILYLPANQASVSGKQPFDFDSLLKELDIYRSNGFRQVAVVLTPHFKNVPPLPQVDENGKSPEPGVGGLQRKNPFDPVFVAEWNRMYREFCAGPLRDERIGRLYIVPPSFFGEVEYYMGEDWFNFRFLAYDAQARARFIEWLTGFYGSPKAAGEAWGTPLNDWNALKLPKPPAMPEKILAGQANEWLDFLDWRTQYLTDLMVQPLKACASQSDKEVGIQVAWGDTTAYHATDTAGIFAHCAGLNNLVLHQTDGHGAADLAYAVAIKRRYHLRRLITENDGDRYGRTELARIVLNCLLAGVDAYNFSFRGHLVDSVNAPTESFRALASAHEALLRAHPRPPLNPIAFLHAISTRNFRAPKYSSKDVSLVYDQQLNNERPYHWYCYSWARWLNMPDVTGEQLILDGDLEGRRVMIVPNTSFTVLPAAVRERLMDWVKAGGTLVAFGSEALAWQLDPPSIKTGHNRCRRVLDFTDPGCVMAESSIQPTAAGQKIFQARPWALPDQPAPVWTGALPEPWQPLLADGQGRAALARRQLGQGWIVLFPQPVPELAKSEENPFYRLNAPLILRAVAEAAHCPFPFQTYGLDASARRPVAPLALKYLGRDAKDQAHVFAAGAYDESAAGLRLVAAKGFTGKARLILVDLPHIAAAYAEGPGQPAIHSNYPEKGHVYVDPTNFENGRACIDPIHPENDPKCLIPIVEIEFEASRPLLISLAPTLK